MSKFAKRKTKSIQRYDKCPTMSLFQIASFLMKDVNMGDKGISSVHLVQDDVSKLTAKYSSSLDNSVDVYITTRLLLAILEEHAVHTDKNYSDRHSYTVTHADGEIETCRLPYSQRYYGRNSIGSKTLPLIAVDLLMYLKESGRVHIEASSETPLTSSSHGQVKYNVLANANLRLTTSPCISQRLELTKVKNHLLESHKDNIKLCNKIRSESSVDTLMNEYFRFPYGDADKDGNRKWTSVFVSYFVELGGDINPQYNAS